MTKEELEKEAEEESRELLKAKKTRMLDAIYDYLEIAKALNVKVSDNVVTMIHRTIQKLPKVA